jgi:hypothetical protein
MHALFMLLAATWLFASVERAFACACCTNAGQRNVTSAKFDSGKRDEIGRLRFGPTAQPFLGESDPDSIKGITAPSDRYELRVSQDKDRLVFSFRDKDGRTGTLTLAFPDSISIFEVDPRGNPDRGQGPSLYKEWKLTSRVSATGIFLPSAGSNQRMTLVIHGSGNSCTSSSDFTHWTLLIFGPAANYSLLGELLR